MARAMGCSDFCSREATSASTSASLKPGATSRSVSSGLPLVRVPVLSRATTRASCSVCSASPLRKSTPSSAALPVPTMMLTGVARPMAQGQAIISTATVLTRAKVRAFSPPNTSHTKAVRAAMASTMGTKTATTRSARFWMGGLEAWAFSTSLIICASTVPSPTAVARKVRVPFWLMVPPITLSPSVLRTGMGSPVIMDSST